MWGTNPLSKFPKHLVKHIGFLQGGARCTPRHSVTMSFPERLLDSMKHMNQMSEMLQKNLVNQTAA